MASWTINVLNSGANYTETIFKAPGVLASGGGGAIVGTGDALGTVACKSVARSIERAKQVIENDRAANLADSAYSVNVVDAGSGSFTETIFKAPGVLGSGGGGAVVGSGADLGTVNTNSPGVSLERAKHVIENDTAANGY